MSARQYVDGFAVNQLLSLIVTSDTEAIDEEKDEIDLRRRLELRSPRLAAEVLSILGEPVPEASLHLLDIAERELKPAAQNLAWDTVTMVRNWIGGLA